MNTETSPQTKDSVVLGWLGYLTVLGVAVSGWALSFRRLHAWGMDALGESSGWAWLVPTTFDLAPLGLSLVVYRMRRKGRSALVWRLGIWAFAGLSAWINYTHAPDFQHGKVIAPLLPLAAVVLFEGLMAEVYHAALERIYKTEIVPKLSLVCWVLSPKRTAKAFKVKALRPLAAAEKVLGITTVPELPSVTPEPAPPAPVLAAAKADPKPTGSKPAPQKRGTVVDLEKAEDIYDKNPAIKGEAFARALHVSRATGFRILKDIKAKKQTVPGGAPA